MTRLRYFDPYSGIDYPANERRGFDWIDVVKIMAVLAGAVCVAEVLL
jgi:hypothetical protein